MDQVKEPYHYGSGMGHAPSIQRELGAIDALGAAF